MLFYIVKEDGTVVTTIRTWSFFVHYSVDQFTQTYILFVSLTMIICFLSEFNDSNHDSFDHLLSALYSRVIIVLYSQSFG